VRESTVATSIMSTVVGQLRYLLPFISDPLSALSFTSPFRYNLFQLPQPAILHFSTSSPCSCKPKLSLARATVRKLRQLQNFLSEAFDARFR
jgi:hypothetical protein